MLKTVKDPNATKTMLDLVEVEAEVLLRTVEDLNATKTTLLVVLVVLVMAVIKLVVVELVYLGGTVYGLSLGAVAAMAPAASQDGIIRSFYLQWDYITRREIVIGENLCYHLAVCSIP